MCQALNIMDLLVKNISELIPKVITESTQGKVPRERQGRGGGCFTKGGPRGDVPRR